MAIHFVVIFLSHIEMLLEFVLLDNIRRRAGLRGTFAVHRHPTTGKNSSTDKHSENPSVSGKRSSMLRQSVLSTALSPAPVTKKVEKDIIKHASRIRTSHSKEMFVRQTSPGRSRKINQSSSVSTSPNRTFKEETKRTKIKRSSRTISLVSSSDQRNKLKQMKNDSIP